MSGITEDTMDVDEDMNMDQDPTATPMSTDEEASQGAAKVVDDVMASPSNEGPIEMEADIIPPPLVEAAPKPQDDAGTTGNIPAPELGGESAEKLDESGSTARLEQSDEGEIQRTDVQDDGNEDNDDSRTKECDRDPLLESNVNSQAELGLREGSNLSNTSVSQDGNDPSSNEEDGNSNAHGKSLAEELSAAGEVQVLPSPQQATIEQSESDTARSESPNDKRDGDKQDMDHISVSGSSALGGDEDHPADHVSIAGSSETEEGPADHVSVDSDSEVEDNSKSGGTKDTVPSDETGADARADSSIKSSVMDQSVGSSTPQLHLKQITALRSNGPVSTNEPLVDTVVSEEVSDTSRPSSAASVVLSAEKFKGSITLLGKQSDSEMITSDALNDTARSSELNPPSVPSPGQTPAPPIMTPQAQTAMKTHYAVKKALPVFSKCLHCSLEKRCPWKVSIGSNDYFICSDKCIEDHRTQRRQILETGAPPVSSIIQIADLSKLEKSCASCLETIPKGKMGSLTWEVMDFCNEDCLTAYQIAHTSKCCSCQIAVNTSSMGKYCVRFGHDVKQFCSPACLDSYKKSVKTCSYCQKNLHDSGEGFLAAIGGKDQFKDFCSQDCLDKYDYVCNNSCASFTVSNCVVCDNPKVTIYELLTTDKVAALCSDVCLAAYKFVNNIQVGVCGMCNKYYDKKGVDESITFNNDSPSSFCSKHCMNISVISKRKIVPCAWCKAKKYNFDMILKRGVKEEDNLFVCSVNCLALHNVSLKALPSQKITCAFCKKFEVSTYHLTMSDATVRHFCSYDCVLAFQAPFNTTVGVSNNLPVPAGAPKKVHIAVTMGATSTTPSADKGLAIQSVGTLSVVEPPPLIPTTVLKLSPAISSPPVTTAAGNRMKQTTLKIPSFCLKPPDMKNKWTQISICSLSKCVSCRPKKEERSSQCSIVEEQSGDDSTVVSQGAGTNSSEKSIDLTNKIFVPIPVPIYIPYPAAMYSLPSPVPLAVPVPIVVPVIVPTALDNMDQVIDTMREILAKSDQNLPSGNGMGPPLTDGDYDKETQNATASRKREFRDDDSKDGEKPVKKARLADESDSEDDRIPEKIKLKYSLGISAWKHFVKRWNESINDEQLECQRLKADILEMRPSELSSALALFIREAKKDNGSPYKPDLKYYLTLGIQYYLFRNKRADDIFGDALYEEFTDALDEEAKKFHVSEDVRVSRVEERHLWESMQLGAKSPQTVLLTLVYFITLHFNLWTIEEHMQLSFSSFIRTNKGPSSNTKVIRLSVTPSESTERKQGVYELMENKQDPLKCPVRLFEFYLTKCPGNVTNHEDRFYLMPESSCLPESPVWYRTLALPPQAIEKMLNRVKLIKEICELRSVPSTVESV